MRQLIQSLIKRIPPVKRILDERAYLRHLVETMGSGFEVPMADAIAQGKHREAIGGRWEEMGKLQFDYLRNHGLAPHHDFLDIGCGSLRGGVKFIEYLEPGHYWGIDNNAALLDAGWAIELLQAGLQHRQPRKQLVCLSDFQFSELRHLFDYAIAQSVFTHLNWNKISLCLVRLAPCMRPGGKFYATFMHVPADHPFEQPMKHPLCTSYGHRDPFHYRDDDFRHAIRHLPWSVQFLGGWNHPTDTHMLEFIRL